MFFFCVVLCCVVRVCCGCGLILSYCGNIVVLVLGQKAVSVSVVYLKGSTRTHNK